MLKLNNSIKNETLNVPTNIKEINIGYVNELIKGVNYNDRHILVAVASTASLFEIASPKLKEVKYSAIPVVVSKCRANHNKIAIIPASSIMNGHHVEFKDNELSLNNIRRFINSDERLVATIQGRSGNIFNDKSAAVNAGTFEKLIKDSERLPVETAIGNYKLSETTVVSLEFKLVPEYDVVGWYEDYGFSDNDSIVKYVCPMI